MKLVKVLVSPTHAMGYWDTFSVFCLLVSPSVNLHKDEFHPPQATHVLSGALLLLRVFLFISGVYMEEECAACDNCNLRWWSSRST